MRLKGKVCIVTGAGNGQGKASALRFANEGASVVVADYDADAGQQTVFEIKKGGLKAEFVKTDVSKSKDVEEMIKFTVEAYEKLDILFNNAGISTRSLGDSGNIADVPEEAWDKNLSVNLKGVFLCCKYAIPEMIKSGGGSIINTSATAGFLGGSGIGPYFSQNPMAGPIAYSAAKGGILPMSKAIGIGYGMHNIRCNVICPGPIDTALMAPRNLSNKEIRESVEAAIPLRRLGMPEDIANAALFLASDESSWMTCQVLIVDGGISSY